MPKTINKTGTALCVVYLALTAFCLYVSFAATDLKGSALFLQLPLLPFLAALQVVRLEYWFTGTHWAVAYAVGLPVILTVLYLVGVALSWLAGVGYERLAGRQDGRGGR